MSLDYCLFSVCVWPEQWWLTIRYWSSKLVTCKRFFDLFVVFLEY
jgi:hypothetical protein